MMSKKIIALAVVMAVSALAFNALAGGVSYKDGDTYMKLGGRIQMQYHRTDKDGHDATDEIRFRRLRPYIEGSVHKDWKGKFQFDFGKSGIELKDCYLQYKGIDDMKVTLGNANTPFSRELLTSSKYQQLVERTFVGDHNYGTPDRQTGIHLTGEVADGMLTWGASVAKAAQDPDEKKLDFEPTTSLERGDDWSEGDMFAARVDLHPMGHLKMSQGDFKREAKATIGVGAFTWANDEDSLNPYAAADPITGEGGHTSKLDVDSVTGFEVSAAIRGGGVSLDAQYNTFETELVDAGITSGIYKNSESTLENYAIEGGVMIVPSKLELVAGYQSQDADGYADAWTKTSVGLNYFVHKHDVKYQVTYDMGENKDGKTGSDVDELFVQAQYVF